MHFLSGEGGGGLLGGEDSHFYTDKGHINKHMIDKYI